VVENERTKNDTLTPAPVISCETLPLNSSQSDTLQVKSPILVKQSGGGTSPFIFYEPGTGAGCNM